MGSVLLSTPIIAPTNLDRHQILRNFCHESVLKGLIQSHVHSMHLSYRVASAGRGTRRDDAVDFSKILGREHDVGGAHILIDVLARFRALHRDNEDPDTLPLSHRPSDGELGERGVFAARNGLKRSTQLEVLLDIRALKARQSLAKSSAANSSTLGTWSLSIPRPSTA